MKTVKDILANVKALQVLGDISILINELKLDSRRVQKGDVFFAVKGTTVDGHTFIPSVIEKGAAVIVCEYLPTDIPSNVVFILVSLKSV